MTNQIQNIRLIPVIDDMQDRELLTEMAKKDEKPHITHYRLQVQRNKVVARILDTIANSAEFIGEKIQIHDRGLTTLIITRSVLMRRLLEALHNSGAPKTIERQADIPPPPKSTDGQRKAS